ncbi:MAG TPA: hypothetical protein VGK73_36945 [Polyangiaceae bacterium]
MLGIAKRIRLCLVAMGGALAYSAPVVAHSARLEWEAPATCPGREALQHAVERLLGAPIEEGSSFEARARVTQDEDGLFTLLLAIRTPDGEGTRTVRGDRCDSILDVAAFGIALALNPDLEIGGTPPEPQAPVPPPVPAAPPPNAEPRVEQVPSLAPETPGPARPLLAPSTAAALEVWLGLHAIGDSSLLPSPALGGGIAAEAVVVEFLRFGIAGALFIPQTEALPGGSGGYFTLWSVDVRACGQARIGVDLAACPVFRFGAVSGEGRGVEPRLAQVSPLYAPGAALLALYDFAPRFAATAGVTSVFPLSRDVFEVDAGPVHRIPAVSFELALGVALRVH